MSVPAEVDDCFSAIVLPVRGPLATAFSKQFIDVLG
jgi:hypothetical protein